MSLISWEHAALWNHASIEDMRLQRWLFDRFRETACLYGFEEYDAAPSACGKRDEQRTVKTPCRPAVCLGHHGHLTLAATGPESVQACRELGLHCSILEHALPPLLGSALILQRL